MKIQEKSYQLIASYVKRKYYISTIYRQASTDEPMWYFETIVWEWDNKTKKRGEMLEIDDSGTDEEQAIENHCAWANYFASCS